MNEKRLPTVLLAVRLVFEVCESWNAIHALWVLCLACAPGLAILYARWKWACVGVCFPQINTLASVDKLNQVYSTLSGQGANRGQLLHMEQGRTRSRPQYTTQRTSTFKTPPIPTVSLHSHANTWTLTNAIIKLNVRNLSFTSQT